MPIPGKGDINLAKEPKVLMKQLVSRYERFVKEQFEQEKWGEGVIDWFSFKLGKQSEKVLKRFDETNEECGHWPKSGNIEPESDETDR